MLGLFLNQNKYYRPEDGFPASVTNPWYIIWVLSFF
jgi:hypothetical protein